MKKSLFSGLALGVSVLLYGCSTTLQVVNYPGFFTDSNTYSSIAIAPVQNDYDYARLAHRAGRDLVNRYVNNGYYDVYDNTGGGNAAADLELFATIVDYGENHDERIDTKQEMRNVYKVDENGDVIYDANGNAVIDYIESYVVEYKVYERTTYANLSVIVLESASGNTLYNRSLGGSCYEEQQDPHLFTSIDEAHWCALSYATADAVYQTSPTLETIAVPDDDLLSIYRYDAEEGWVDDSDIAADGVFKLRVWFPQVAMYNTFHIDIVAEDNDVVLSQEKIYWEGNVIEIEYKMADLITHSDGMSEYKVRLWNGNRIALEKTIDVE